jgi:hypothetical protein
MIVNLKTAKVLGSTLKCRPLLGRAAIEQLTNDDYPDARLWQIVLQKFQNALRLIFREKTKQSQSPIDVSSSAPVVVIVTSAICSPRRSISHAIVLPLVKWILQDGACSQTAREASQTPWVREKGSSLSSCTNVVHRMSEVGTLRHAGGL